jgi:hypothetical protein
MSMLSAPTSAMICCAESTPRPGISDSRWTDSGCWLSRAAIYIGLEVHQAIIVVAVMDSTGKLVMESILETKAASIVQFFAGLRGTLSVTFEEGTWSAWLYDLLHPRVRSGHLHFLTGFRTTWDRQEAKVPLDDPTS